MISLEKLAEKVIEKADWEKLGILNKEWVDPKKYPHRQIIRKYTEKEFVLNTCCMRMVGTLRLHQLPETTKLRIADLATGFGWFPLACECLGHEVLSLDGGEPGMFEGAACLQLREQPLLYKIEEFKPLPPQFKNLDLITMIGCNLRKKNGAAFDKEHYKFFIKDLYSRLNPEGKIFIRLNHSPLFPLDLYTINYWRTVAEETDLIVSFSGNADITFVKPIKKSFLNKIKDNLINRLNRNK